MKLVVTGGAGYIGSIVAELLVKSGHSVTVIDNLSTGHDGAVPGGARLVRGDIRDGETLKAGIEEGVDCVLHFAAASVVAESMEKPLYYFDNNVGGAVSLLRAMRERNVKRMIFSSSAAVYGTPDRLPIAEDSPTRPENPYGETKLAIEKLLGACARAWGLGYVSLRYFNAAGSTEERGEDHRPESHLLPIVIDVALGKREMLTIYGDDYDTPDGTCIRDYIHVMDLAEAHLLALSALENGFSGALNLGSEKPHSVLEIVKTVERVTGRAVPYRIGPRRPGDPPALLASSDLAGEVLGWKRARSSLEEIVESAYRWRLSHPHGYGD